MPPLHMREQILRALLAHAQGDIAKHKANVEVYLEHPAGVGEHTDILDWNMVSEWLASRNEKFLKLFGICPKLLFCKKYVFFKLPVLINWLVLLDFNLLCKYGSKLEMFSDVVITVGRFFMFLWFNICNIFSDAHVELLVFEIPSRIKTG